MSQFENLKMGSAVLEVYLSTLFSLSCDLSLKDYPPNELDLIFKSSNFQISNHSTFAAFSAFAIFTAS